MSLTYNPDTSLIISGFKNVEDKLSFVNWYINQGEQYYSDYLSLQERIGNYISKDWPTHITPNKELVLG